MTANETPPPGRLARGARAAAGLLFCLGLLAVPVLTSPPLGAAQEDAPGDPFGVLSRMRGTPVLVPPRALAVIPERHTGRAIRMVDRLERIQPQFDDYARGFGLSPQRAIQLFTREASIPIYVAKSDSTVSTVLQLELGTEIEVRGILVERGGQYLFLASDVRASPAQRRRRR